MSNVLNQRFDLITQPITFPNRELLLAMLAEIQGKAIQYQADLAEPRNEGLRKHLALNKLSMGWQAASNLGAFIYLTRPRNNINLVYRDLVRGDPKWEDPSHYKYFEIWLAAMATGEAGYCSDFGDKGLHIAEKAYADWLANLDPQVLNFFDPMLRRVEVSHNLLIERIRDDLYFKVIQQIYILRNQAGHFLLQQWQKYKSWLTENLSPVEISFLEEIIQKVAQSDEADHVGIWLSIQNKPAKISAMLEVLREFSELNWDDYRAGKGLYAGSRRAV